MNPSDRYSARVDLSPSLSPWIRHSSVLAGHDRLRTPRSAQPARSGLDVELSERDIGVLHSVRLLRLMQADQLQRLHFTEHATDAAGKRICRRVLQRLHERGMLHRLQRRIGGIRAGSTGHVYALAPKGHRLLSGRSSRRRNHEPSTGFVRHTLAIAELATRLLETAHTGAVEVLELATEPWCWRHPEGTRVRTAASAVLKPDLHVVLANDESELHWFVEVDLGTEAPSTLARKCRTYTDYFRSGHEQARTGIFPKVLFVAPDDERRHQIERSIGRGGIESALFEVAIDADALDVLIGQSGGTS
ncbi:MAG: replication-relaxation family protein [Actinomycetota bacterium]